MQHENRSADGLPLDARDDRVRDHALVPQAQPDRRSRASGIRRARTIRRGRPSRRVFGSWNAAMQAAGFTPRPRGRQPRSLTEGAPCRRVAPESCSCPATGSGRRSRARRGSCSRCSRPTSTLEERLIGAAAIRATGDRRCREETLDACLVGGRGAEGPGRRSGVRRGRRASGAGPARPARGARHVREPAAGRARRRRRADRARARRRPLLRRERHARRRNGVRHVRVPPAPGRAHRAPRVRARASRAAAS